ncbi:ABC transporter ATP-binding protein [Viscerimonas tarda]
MNKIIISANNISIGYPGTPHREGLRLYDNLSVELNAGELTCLLGPNGVGKSTLLRTLSAMQLPLSGEVYLHGKPLDGYSERELSCELGVVLTDKTSVGGLTVSQLVSLGRYPYTGFFGKLSRYDHAVVDKAIKDVGIDHKAQSYMAELSDGERQKAMIAKALAQECPVILLDEPTAFLDVASRIEIMELLHHLAFTQQKTILLSTHDIESAFLFADRLWLLSRERGLESGVTEDILLSESMSLFMDKKNILFDKQTGSFLPRKTFDRTVFLTAEGNLYHWTKNFLRRNNWDVSPEKSASDFSLTALSKDKFLLVRGSVEIEMNSFNQLYKWLINNY